MERVHTATLDAINKLLEYTPEYQHIKDIAKQDLGEELINRVESFLEEQHKTKPAEEIKKVVFEDASNVHEEDINNIVDAFVKIRSENTLDQIEKRSIDDILRLFNQWIMIGKDQQSSLPKDVFEGLTPLETLPELEEKVAALQQEITPEEMYGSENPYISRENMYQGSEEFIDEVHELVYNNRGIYQPNT